MKNINELDYFYKLKTISNCADSLLYKALNPENSWKNVTGQNVLKLTFDDFSNDPKILKMIEHFKCRLNIIKLLPRSSYSWHKDHIIRPAAINMLLEGWDSITIMGKSVQIGRIFQDLVKIPYEKNRFVLLNVHQWHAVYNFSETRYLLSISIPIQSANYLETLTYIKENDL